MNYLFITNLFPPKRRANQEFHLEILELLYILQTANISGPTSWFLYWGLHLFVVRVTAPPVTRGLSQYLPEGTGERYKKPQSGQPVSRPEFVPGAFREHSEAIWLEQVARWSSVPRQCSLPCCIFGTVNFC